MPIVLDAGTVTPSPVLENVLARIKLTGLTPAGTYAVQYHRYEWSMDTVKWTPVRGYERIPAAPDVPTVAYDYEVPSNTDWHFRVSSIRVSDAGEDIISAPSPVVTVSLSLRTWWLKDVIDPSRNMTLWLSGESVSYTEPQVQGVFNPLGRKNKVVVSDVVQGHELDLSLYFDTQQWFEQFRALRNSQRVLLLQNPLGEQWYVRMVGDAEVSRSGIGNNRRRLVSVSFVEQDRP